MTSQSLKKMLVCHDPLTTICKEETLIQDILLVNDSFKEMFLRYDMDIHIIIRFRLHTDEGVNHLIGLTKDPIFTCADC